MAVTIWHNPRCSQSRSALALIRAAGVAPVVVDYLAEPPDVPTLRRVLAAAGLSARALLRDKEARVLAPELGQADEDTLLAAMAADPRLINRPVVMSDRGARLCRPPERVLEIL